MASAVPPYISPPPGFNYIRAVEPCFTFVLISLPLSSMLVPILFLMIFSSTKDSRKTLLFSLNILIVLLGIVEGILSTIVQREIILNPKYPVSDRLFLAYIGVAFFTPILVDCVLILRLFAVFPVTITPRLTRNAIVAVPLLCTATRITCVTILVRHWAILGYQTSALMAGNVVWRRNSMIIADWSLQLFENLYCSGLFLFRLRGHTALSSRMYYHQSIAARLRTILYIAISNFVFPSILSIVQLTFIIHDPSVVHGAIVLMINNYISIIGVIFSTIWCSTDIWKREHNPKTSVAFGTNTHDLPAAVFPQSIITLSGIAPNINNPTDPHVPQSLVQVHMHASQEYRPHPFANIMPPYEEVERDGKDSGSGSMNLACSIEGDGADAILQSLTGAVPQPHTKPVANESSLSSSPVTPLDVSIDFGGNQEKSDLEWEPAVAPPRINEGNHRPEGRQRETSPDAADKDIDLNFAAPMPPQSDRKRWHHRPRSRFSTDSLDYDARGALAHPRDLDITDIRVSPAFIQDDSDGHLGSCGGDERYGHLFVEDQRRRRPVVDTGAGLSSLETDRPLPPHTLAHRSSISDWSDAGTGGHTPAS